MSESGFPLFCLAFKRALPNNIAPQMLQNIFSGFSALVPTDSPFLSLVGAFALARGVEMVAGTTCLASSCFNVKGIPGKKQ